MKRIRRVWVCVSATGQCLVAHNRETARNWKAGNERVYPAVVIWTEPAKPKRRKRA